MICYICVRVGDVRVTLSLQIDWISSEIDCYNHNCGWSTVGGAWIKFGHVEHLRSMIHCLWLLWRVFDVFARCVFNMLRDMFADRVSIWTRCVNLICVNRCECVTICVLHDWVAYVWRIYAIRKNRARYVLNSCVNIIFIYRGTTSITASAWHATTTK